jgi:hypothetical protein
VVDYEGSASETAGEARDASGRRLLIVPNPQQARRLTLYLYAFLAAWGLILLGLAADVPALFVGSLLIALLSYFGFNIVLTQVWTGWSVLKSIVNPFSYAWSRYEDLVRPRWVRSTIRSTGWNGAAVFTGVIVLLAADVTFFMVLIGSR